MFKLLECVSLGNALWHWLWLQAWPLASFGQKVAANITEDLKNICTIGLALFLLLESWIWQAWTSLLDDKKHVVWLPCQPRWEIANWQCEIWPSYTIQPRKPPAGCWPLIDKWDQLSLAQSFDWTHLNCLSADSETKTKHCLKSLTFRLACYAEKQS